MPGFIATGVTFFRGNDGDSGATKLRHLNCGTQYLENSADADDLLDGRSALSNQSDGLGRMSMITLQKILVPTDFSDFSQRALEFALPLAEKFQAKIYLMHVWQLPMTSSLLPAEPYSEEVWTEAQKTGAEHLTKVAGELKASGFDIELVFTLGKPYVEIVKAATSLDADLIVLASHGRSGVSHLVLGSV